VRTLAIIIVLLMTVLKGHAEEFSPYFCASAHVGDVYRFKSVNTKLEFNYERPFLGGGSQFEAGITSESNSYYIAYYHFSSDDYSTFESGFGWHHNWERFEWHTNTAWTWKEELIAIGGRLHLNSGRHFKVQPIIGIGIMLCQSRLTSDRQYAYYDTSGNAVYTSHWRTSHWSDVYPGLCTEFGFLIHVAKSVDVNMLSQLHCFWTELPGDVGTKNEYFVVAQSLQLGILYSFK